MRWRVAERRPPPDAGAAFLVVGLGNPGAEYQGTRHNVGAEVVEILAARHSGRLRRSKERALAGEISIDGRRIALAVPLTFMNLSGEAVGSLVRRYHVRPDQTVVVHDELDLPLSRLQVKSGGGLAGHNGLGSIVAHLHTNEFLRVRIGIGRPPGRREGADHVLRRFSKAERALVEVALEEAADAVEAIVVDGPVAAMNRFNRAPSASPDEG